jgi:hypothetical protein
MRPIRVEDSFYFTSKRAISENFRMFRRIALKLSKKTLCIGIPALVNSLPIGLKFSNETQG